MKLNIPNYFQKSTTIKTIWEHVFYMSTTLKMLDFMFSKLLEKGVPENTEAPSNEILEILNMGSISSLKHARFSFVFYFVFSMPIIYNRIIF